MSKLNCDNCAYTKLVRMSARGLLPFSTDRPNIDGLYLTWNEDDGYELVSWIKGNWLEPESVPEKWMLIESYDDSPTVLEASNGHTD